MIKRREVDMEDVVDTIYGGEKGYITFSGKTFRKWHRVEKYFKGYSIEELEYLDTKDILVRTTKDEVPDGYRDRIWFVSVNC